MTKRKSNTQSNLESADRRKMIQGLGALALTTSTLPMIGCSEEDDEPGTTDLEDTSGNSAGDGGSMNSGNSAGTTSAGQTAAADDLPASDDDPSMAGMDSTDMAPPPSTDMEGAAPEDNMPADDDAIMDEADASMPDPDMALPDSPMFDDVTSCTLTPTDAAGEGPFFIHNAEIMDDVELFRQDIRDGHEGVELQLNLRMLDTSTDCVSPMAGVEVYVWHTDALGFYSGFNNQNPDMPYAGAFERVPENDERFCRGAQTTDDNGVVSFTTLYPGWYNGRPIHIHFLALKPGSGAATESYRGEDYAVFTTQMYFEADFSRMILEGNAPYNTRVSGQGYESSLIPASEVRPTVRMEGDAIVASLNILTDSSESRISSGFGAFGRP